MINYEGTKSRLRPLRETDKRWSIVWRNDPEVRENATGHRFPVTQEMEDRWYESALNDQSHSRAIFAIEDKEDDQCVGFIQLNRIDWIARTAGFAIVIGQKDRQGKGIAPDAMHVLMRYGFECLNLRKIYLEVPEYNERARQLYIEFGFAQEGTLKDHVFLRDRYFSLILMAIFRDDYEKKYPRKHS